MDGSQHKLRGRDESKPSAGPHHDAAVKHGAVGTFNVQKAALESVAGNGTLSSTRET